MKRGWQGGLLFRIPHSPENPNDFAHFFVVLEAALRTFRAAHGQRGMTASQDRNPRSPGTHIVGPWVIDSINLCRDLRTGTRYIGNWASRERKKVIMRSTCLLALNAM